MTGPAGRILIFSPWPSIWSMGSGAGTPMEHDLLEALRRAGYTVDLVLPPAEGDSYRSDDSGIHVFRIGRARLPATGYLGRWLAWGELAGRFAARGLALARTRGRPSLVYGLSSLTVPAAALVGRLLDRPSIGFLFGTFLYPILGQPHRLANNFAEVIAFKTPVTRLIVLDDGTRGDRVAEHFGVPPHRVRFWPHGIDHEACAAAAADPLSRATIGVREDAPLVVSASRLADWKRVDRVIRALPGVLRAHPTAVLAIAGSGPEREALERLARDLGVGDSVRFLGALPRAENLRLIASADVFCSFYEYSNVGVALLEALTCGVAVVVTDAGATREIVEDEVTGLVVPPDDHEAAADAMSSLLADADLRARLATSARRRAEERFLTREQRMRMEIELVEEVTGITRSSSRVA